MPRTRLIFRLDKSFLQESTWTSYIKPETLTRTIASFLLLLRKSRGTRDTIKQTEKSNPPCRCKHPPKWSAREFSERMHPSRVRIGKTDMVSTGARTACTDERSGANTHLIRNHYRDNVEMITPVLLLVPTLALYWLWVLGQDAWSVICQIFLSILRQIQYHWFPIIGLTVGQVLAAVTVRLPLQYCPSTGNQAWNEALLK